MLKTHTSRMAAAFVGSFALNMALLVFPASYDPNRGPRPLADRILDMLGMPGGLLAAPFSTHGNMALAVILSSLFFYWVVLWAVVEILATVSAHIRGRKAGTDAT
jgi:hypothetical protein